MKGSGTVVSVSAVVGGLHAEVTLENGSKWKFDGALIGFQGGFGALEGSGDFPGADHIEGLCTVSLFGAGLGPGNWEVRWSDTHGEIGNLKGKGIGAQIAAAGGGGSWSRG